jgi:homoserine kinase
VTVATPARVRVTVPASTANLGSGYDTLGMALGLYDVVDVEVTDGEPRTATVSVTGQGAGAVPKDERHLVVRALHQAWDDLGVATPALRLSCHNVIPHSRGLGSSAAAIVAGIAAAYALAGFCLRNKENTDRALQLAATIEGHADNVAASLAGGLVIAWNEGDVFHAASLPPHPTVTPVALIPPGKSATHVTRGLIPERIPHCDGAFAASRAALAVHALTTDPTLLLPATADRLHQDYRKTAWPETLALVQRLRSVGVAAVVSGAGPAVLAFPYGDLPDAVELGDFVAYSLAVDYQGVQVEMSSMGPM